MIFKRHFYPCLFLFNCFLIGQFKVELRVNPQEVNGLMCRHVTLSHIHHRFICHGLMTGEKYVFRVRAVNAAGLSQFSPESEPVEVKAAIGE